MLHIIKENKDLKGRRFMIGPNLLRHLTDTLQNYNGDRNIEGYKRLNSLIDMANNGGVRYEEMKRIKNWFDTHDKARNTDEYKLNGGDMMRNWIDLTLNDATKAIRDWKQARKDAGEKNAFIKHHEKDRQSKRKNKPTTAKVQTNNAGKSIYNNNAVRYESKEERTLILTEEQLKCLKEKIDK